MGIEEKVGETIRETTPYDIEPRKFRSELLGTVIIRKSTKARRMNARYDFDSNLIVTIPADRRFEEALQFLADKADRLTGIRKNLERPVPPVPETFHESWNLSDFEKDVIRNYDSGCREELKAIAGRILPQMTREIAENMGYSFRNVKVKEMTSKWGSCSVLRNINLNMHLVRLPYRLCEFVIIHELCHLDEMNHGEGFRKLLDIHTGGKAQELKEELRNYDILLARRYE